MAYAHSVLAMFCGLYSPIRLIARLLVTCRISSPGSNSSLARAHIVTAMCCEENSSIMSATVRAVLSSSGLPAPQGPPEVSDGQDGRC